MAPPHKQAINVRTLKILKSAFSASSRQQNYGPVGGPTIVVVEYKSYEVNRVIVIHDVASNRISRLIALFHGVKDSVFEVLRCINYFDEVLQRRIGMVFELRPQLDGPPNPLFAALSSSSSSRPSLDARMRLAHLLAETMLLLHSVDWLHKSIRRETVLMEADTSPQMR